MAKSSVPDPFYDVALKHSGPLRYWAAPSLPTIPACHKPETQGEGETANKFKSLWAELGKYSGKSQSFFQTERGLIGGIVFPALICSSCSVAVGFPTREP